jgi:uncharacterized repeat protein (TIGR03803 family)
MGGLVLGNDGNFYGTTMSGGASGSGTFFRIAPSGTFANLYSFDPDGTPAGSALPRAALVLGNDGNFYGTATAYGAGTAFRITPGGTLTTLHTFQYTDGVDPFGALALGTDGNFYGTTVDGGAKGNGVIFQMTPSGTVTVLHSFDGADGSSPWAGLALGPDGNFYGSTTMGGASGSGTLFEITPDGVFIPLHSFSGADGYMPQAALLLGKDGSFYGTSEGGGTGTIFRWLPSRHASLRRNQSPR